MTRLVIIVEFGIRPGRMSDFLPLITQNARLSVEREPGCSIFDVLLTVPESDNVVLYEVYADADAFAEHVRSQHYREFDEASAALVASKRVMRLTDRT